MADQFLTFAAFLTQIKLEAAINDTSCDAWLLNATNEVLTEIISNTKDLRDFAVDLKDIAISTQFSTTITGTYLARIEQIYYQFFPLDAEPQERFQLTEQTGILTPLSPRFLNLPNSYSLVNTTVAGNAPSYLMTFYPRGRAVVTDKIQIVGAGFKHILTTADLMPYTSVYPMLFRSLLQRLQIYRNKPKDTVDQWSPLIQRAATGAAASTKEKGNSESSPNDS